MCRQKLQNVSRRCSSPALFSSQAAIYLGRLPVHTIWHDWILQALQVLQHAPGSSNLLHAYATQCNHDLEKSKVQRLLLGNWSAVMMMTYQLAAQVVGHTVIHHHGYRQLRQSLMHDKAGSTHLGQLASTGSHLRGPGQGRAQVSCVTILHGKGQARLGTRHLSWT